MITLRFENHGTGYKFIEVGTFSQAVTYALESKCIIRGGKLIDCATDGIVSYTPKNKLEGLLDWKDYKERYININKLDWDELESLIPVFEHNKFSGNDRKIVLEGLKKYQPDFYEEYIKDLYD